MNISSFGGMQRPDPSAMREKMFQKADADGDGSVSKDELKTMMADMPAPPQGMGGTQAPSADKLFGQIDTDSDGQISKTEFDAFGASMGKKIQAQIGSSGVGSFSGSTDVLKSLLDALQQDDKDDTKSKIKSAHASATDSNSTDITKLIASLIEQMRNNQSQYTANGTSQSASGQNIFSTSA